MEAEHLVVDSQIGHYYVFNRLVKEQQHVMQNNYQDIQEKYQDFSAF